jgi:membrane-bound lytic murein transglycosylase D
MKTWVLITVSLGLLLRTAGLFAQEERLESQDLEDVEALEALEEAALRDLLDIHQTRVEEPLYEGLSESEWTIGVTTVVEIPHACGDAAWGQPTPGADSGPLDTAPGVDWGWDPADLEPSEIPPAVAHFDLSSVEPLFGIEDLDQEPIQNFLYILTTDGRRRLTRMIARSGRYSDLIRSRLREAGLPEELIYLAMIESGFNPTAVSRAAAVGLWQFMERTGRGRGLEVSRRYDERNDPELATDAAIDYLTSLHDRFESWPIAMAAYNAGGGYTRGQLRQYNLNDFWAMGDYGAIYSDTRRYVYRIIASAIIGENPQLFGFEGIVSEDPVVYDTVQVPGGTRLSTFARAADCDVDELLELNPALRTASTPSSVELFDLHLPVGTLDHFIAEYDGVDLGDRAFVHTLRFGETPAHLSAIYGLRDHVIRRANGLSRRESVPYGTDLVIPLSPESAQGALDAHRPYADLDEDERPVVITPALQFDYPERTTVIYEVQTDDNLYDIAAALELSPYDLATWNDLDPDAALHSEMTLLAYVAADAPLNNVRLLTEDQVQVLALGSEGYEAWRAQQERRRQSRRRTYTVRRGDSVSTIARRFGVTSREIIRWNDLDNPNRIRAGTELRVH